MLPASLLVILGCNLCLDTLWLSTLMGDGYLALLPAQPVFKMRVDAVPIHLILIPFVLEPHRIEDTVCRTDDGVEKFSLDPKSPYAIIKSRGNRRTVSLWSFADDCLQLSK